MTSSPRLAEEARAKLSELVKADTSTGQWSVDHCAEQQRYWLEMFLSCDARVKASTKPMERKQALNELRFASEQAGEWEKRKAGAMMGLRVDLLREVLRRLDEQDALSDELLEIEE